MRVEQVEIRDARDDDEHGLISLVDACFQEYPGCVTDVDGEMPELRAIASYAEKCGGRFWVAELGGRIVGSVGVVPSGNGGYELLKLYVSAEGRSNGLGRTLVGLVEDEARNRGAGYVELWTDTRFTRAHRLYELLGYRSSGRTRDLQDKSNSSEFHYVRAWGAWDARVAASFK
jgi:putative acetyltransferase